MKSDNLKRNDVAPAVVSGAFTATSVVVTNLAVSGPFRGDFQIVDEGRLIVGNDPDTGSRGILSPTALRGYGLNGGNSFALWFASVEGHTAGDFHAGNLGGNYLAYSQDAGTLGLYSAGGVGVLFDNDGSLTAGDPHGAHMAWDVASQSLKIGAGATVSAEFMADGSAALGRMTLRDVLTAGDVDGPSVTLGRFVTSGVESAEIILTDDANNPWFHAVAGGGTAYGGYFSLGQQGNYENRLTYDGEYLTVNGVVIAAAGSQFGGLGVQADGAVKANNYKLTDGGIVYGTSAGDMIEWRDNLTGTVRMQLWATAGSGGFLDTNTQLLGLSGGNVQIIAGAGGTGTVEVKVGSGGPVLFKAENGSKIAFYGVATVARQLLATGASHTVDDVITALQTLGLVKQS